MKIKTLIFPIHNIKNINGYKYNYCNLKEKYLNYKGKYLNLDKEENISSIGKIEKIYEENGLFYMDLELFNDFKLISMLNINNFKINNIKNVFLIVSSKTGNIENGIANVDKLLGFNLVKSKNILTKEHIKLLKTIKRKNMIKKILNNI